MAVPLNPPGFQYCDNNGDPLALGLIYTYQSGTLTPKATYTDADEGSQNTNPVELDASGRASIWVNGTYKIVVKTAAGVTIDTQDKVPSFASGSVGTTVTDTGFTIQNASDPTKQFQFLASGISPGSSTVGTLPDGNFTFATKASVDARTTVAAFTGKPLYGLTLSNNGTDANNDIDIAAGSGVSDDGTTLMTVTAITKRLDASWAVGTNQGGLDTGGEANSTWYHVWLIHRTDTSITDVLFSTSATAPTMPANYTKKLRIGAIRNDGSGNILPFVQFDKTFLWKSPTEDLSFSSASTASLRIPKVPTGVKVCPIMTVLFGSGSIYHYLSSPDTTDIAVNGTTTPFATWLGGGANYTDHFDGKNVVTNTSGEFRIRSSGIETLKMATIGWMEIW